MPLLGGRLCEVAYTISLPPFPKFLVLQSTRRGHGRLCPLPMPLTVVQPGFVNGGPKRGSEATERWRVWEVPRYREIFEISCMKTAFSCTLNDIIRGSLCSGIDQFPTLFPSPPFFFYSPTNRGPWSPCAPLATPVPPPPPAQAPHAWAAQLKLKHTLQIELYHTK